MKSFNTFLLLLVLILPSWAAKRRIELLNAQHNTNRITNGSMTSILTGDVRFKVGETLINADKTIWYRSSNHLKLLGNVHIVEGTQNLYCDTAIYFSSKKKFNFRGGVTAIDSTRETTITSQRASYLLTPDSLILYDEPKVIFWSSTSDDTVTITGVQMYYAGESNTAAALDSVEFLATDLVGTADTAYFYLHGEEGLLFGSRPNFAFQQSSVEGDSIRCYFGDGALNSFRSVGEPIVTNTEKDDSTEVLSTMIADTILFHITDNAIDTVYAFHSAIVSRINGNLASEADSLWGDTIITVIETDNTGSSQSTGNPRTIYAEDTNRNSVASDTITLYFDNDGVHQVELSGGVQGLFWSVPDDSAAKPSPDKPKEK